MYTVSLAQSRCRVDCRVLSCWSPEDGPQHVKMVLEWKPYFADR